MLRNFSRVDLDNERSLVKMFDSELATSKSRQKVNLDFGNEIVFLSTESVVWLLLNDNNNVSGLSRRRLVGFATKNDGLTTLHTLVDVDLQHLLVRNDLLALAGCATILRVDVLASTRTVVTSSLDLLNHRTHLAHDNFDTTTITTGTCPHSPVLSSLALTLGAEDVTCQCEFRRLAPVQLLEGDVYTVDKILRFAGTL